MSLVSVKSTLVLPFSYRLTRVVPEKGPLNVRACVCVCVLLIETVGRAEPPKLSLDERFRQVRAHVGGTAKVSVGVEGEPAPAVTWYKDAAPLRARSNVVVDVGDSSTGIVMRRLTREDAGDYEVVAKNDWGTTKERFSVAVVGMCDVYFF